MVHDDGATNIDPDQTPPPKSWSRAGIVSAVVGFAFIVVFGTVSVLAYLHAQAVSRPGFVVSTYLTDVEHGHIEAAMKLDHHVARTEDVLLTDAAYAKVTDRVSGFQLLKASVTRSGARVEASVVQKSGTSTATFQLVRGAWTPLALLGFEHWKLQPATMSTVTVTLGAPGRIAATVAGTDVKWKGSILKLDAFPGRYPLAVSEDSPCFTLAGTKTTVEGFDDHRELKTAAQLTPKGTAAIVTAANASLDECVASTVVAPIGCSFGLNNGPPAGETWTNVSWTLVTRPQLRVGAWDFSCRGPMQASVSVGGCWPVTTTTPGAVTFHADYLIGATGENGDIVTAAPIAAIVEGEGTSFTDSAALFFSVRWNEGS
jgi:hypothetical protein